VRKGPAERENFKKVLRGGGRGKVGARRTKHPGGVHRRKLQEKRGRRKKP